MDVIFALLLCALGFFIYLTDKNKNEILVLKKELREKNKQAELKPQSTPEIANTELVHEMPPPRRPRLAPEPNRRPKSNRIDENTFVSVIFKKSSKKRYDYLLGNNYDVRVGDFVVVYINDKFSGGIKWKIAQVVYMSKPGECSRHANSIVIKKADYPKW